MADLPLAVGPAISTARADPILSSESSMSHVLSLIAAKAKALSTADLDHARRALAKAAAEPGAPDWLSPGEACDIPFEGAPDTALAAAREAFAGEPVDVNALPAAARRKKLFLADMDSTMIGQECIDELAAELGLREHVSAITERAMRGEIAFEPALRERVALLKGLPLDTVGQVLANRITLTPGGKELVATMRASGAHTVLVSGGFTLFTGDIAARLGFHENRANRLVTDDRTFAGLVVEPILGRAAKQEALAELTRKLGLEARGDARHRRRRQRCRHDRAGRSRRRLPRQAGTPRRRRRRHRPRRSHRRAVPAGFSARGVFSRLD